MEIFWWNYSLKKWVNKQDLLLLVYSFIHSFSLSIQRLYKLKETTVILRKLNMLLCVDKQMLIDSGHATVAESFHTNTELLTWCLYDNKWKHITQRSLNSHCWTQNTQATLHCAPLLWGNTTKSWLVKPTFRSLNIIWKPCLLFFFSFPTCHGFVHFFNFPSPCWSLHKRFA